MTDAGPKTLRTTTPTPTLTLSGDELEEARGLLARGRHAATNAEPRPLDVDAYASQWSHTRALLDPKDFGSRDLRMKEVFRAVDGGEEVTQQAWRAALTQYAVMRGFTPNHLFVGTLHLAPAAFDFALTVAAAAARAEGTSFALEALVDLDPWRADTPPEIDHDDALSAVLSLLSKWALSHASSLHPAGLCFASAARPSHFADACERRLGLARLIAACEDACEDERFVWWVLATLKLDVPWSTYEARREAVAAWLERGASRDVARGLPKTCILRIARALLDEHLTRHLLDEGVQLRIWHVVHALRDAPAGDTVGALSTNYGNDPITAPDGWGNDSESGLGYSVPSPEAIALHLGPGAPGLVDLFVARDLASGYGATTRSLARMSSPALVAHFYDILQLKKKRHLWPDLEEFMEWDGANAIAGLVTLAERRGKRRTFALEHLRSYVRRGHGRLVAAALEGAPAKLAALLREELLSEQGQELADATTATGATSYQAAADTSPTLDLADAPGWLADVLALPAAFTPDPRHDAIVWPAVRLAGTDTLLPPDALAGIARALRAARAWRGDDENPMPEDLDDDARAALTRAKDALERLPEVLDARGADALWGALFHHAPSRWAMAALALLGGPGAFERAGQILRKDPHAEPSDVRRDAVGRALLARGDLRAWAQILSVPALARRQKQDYFLQRDCHAKLAERHGWDRRRALANLSPPFGLGADGAAHFDYGGRVVTLRVDASLQVVVSDDTGKTLSSLPGARKGEDRVLVATHKKRMKWMRAILERAIADAAARFEDELRDMYPRTLGELRAHVLSHPWRRFFVRSLIWGTYDGLELDRAFLCDADGSLVGADFDTLELPDDATVRLVHPAELSEDARRAWSEVLTDSEIVQPLPQLQRPVLGPDDWEAERARFARASLGHKQETSKRLRAMEQWEERSTRHGTRYGRVWFPERAFPELGVRARLLFDARQWDFVVDGELEKTDGLHVFASASDSDPEDFTRVRPVPLDELPARVASELVLLLRG